MDHAKEKTARRVMRHKRIRAKISGTPERPRLTVSRSNRFITAQLIDDTVGATLVYVSSRGMKGTPKEHAFKVGEVIAQEAKKKGIEQVVFDRGGFQFAGKVQAVAESARKGGLVF